MNVDRLTELNDRDAFMTLMRRHCEQALNMGTTFGLLVVDLNRFRKINGAFGYRVGDQVLAQMAGVLGSVARKRDLLARIGDNQFAMLLPGLMNAGHAVLAAAKLLRLLEVPLEIEQHKIRVRATVGIAAFPDHGKHGDVLLAAAEDALARAREEKHPYALAESIKRAERPEAFDIEFGLQSAVSGGELELYYQPKLHMRRMVPVGAEALIRWRCPTRGWVMPDEFIPVAEQTGAIMGITQWVINTALRESNDWPSPDGPLSIAVNLSPRVLSEPTLIDMIRGSVGLWEARSDCLVLEVTESSAMDNTESVFSLFRQIKDLGARVSLDDFGTGYSSLAHFREIPADELKLDKSFVTQMVTTAADRHIAKLVIDLAHAFGMTVVAEGVEDPEAYILLAKLGCDHAQGYFIGKPMPQKDFRRWLERYRGLDRLGPRLKDAEAARTG